MRIKKLLLALLGAFSLHGYGQTDINFADNCLIIPDYEGLYGFIVGVSHNKKEAYFTVIKKDKKFDQSIKVAFNKEKEKYTATLINEDIKIGLFYLALYKVEGRESIQKKYFKSTADYKGDYKLFTDGNRGRVRGAWQRRMDLYIHPRFNLTRMRDKNDYRYEQLNFGCSLPGHFGFGGLPIIDARGNVAGIIAQDQKDNESSVYVLDIYAIRQKLMQAGGREGDECKYFNLIEAGSVNDETYCEMGRRLQREDAKRRDIAEMRRIQLLKQEDKKLIDEKVRKFGKSTLERVQKRIYNQNIDRPIAFSALANGSISIMQMKDPPGSSGSGSTNSLDEDSYSFFVGMGIHINPDRGRLRFVLKPGYAEYGFKIKTGNYGTSASGFDLKKLRIKAYELSAMTEVVTKRTEKSNNYFGFGYGYGRTNSLTFGFDTKAESGRKQVVIGKPMYYHKFLAEVGHESTKFRLALFAGYQLGPVTNKDYELILAGESVYPFRDIPNGFVVIGIEGAFRLWSQWRNDYKTMFNSN